MALKVVKNLITIMILACSALLASTAPAAPLTFNIDGVITDSGGQPVEAPAVTFRIDIQNPSEDCLLYREDFLVDMSNSNGYFTIVVGKTANLVSGGSTLDKVFSNQATAIPGQGVACPYTPGTSTETRKIIVSFNDGLGSQVFSTQEIQSVPFALESVQSTKVGDYSPRELLKVDSSVLQTTNPNTALNQTQYDEFWALILGTTTTYLKAIPTLGGDISGTLPAMSVDKIKGYTIASPAGPADDGKVLSFNSGTGWTLQTSPLPGDSSYTAKGIVQFDTDAAVSGMTLTSGVAKVNVGTGANQIIQLDGTSKLPPVDGSQLTSVIVSDSSITSAKILDETIVNTDISNTAAIAWSKIASPTTLTAYGITDAVQNLGGVPSLSSGTLAVRPAAGTAGRIYYATDTKQEFRDTGATWDQLNTNASDFTSGTLPAARLPALTGDVTSSAGSNSISINTVPTSKGGTGLTVAGTANQILGVNNSATGMEYKTITAGSGVTVTPSSGNVTIAAINNGTVTSVSGTAPISVATGTSTPVVSITAGTATGQALRWNGSAWDSGFIAMTDLRSTVTGVSSFASSCSSNETLTYDSISDVMSCANIVIANTQVTGLGALATKSTADLSADVTGILPVANGGTGTTNGSIAGTGSLTFAAGGTDQNITLTPSGTGKVGIGTASPSSLVHLSGVGGTPLQMIHSSTDTSSALALATNWNIWYVGQNRPPDNIGPGAADSFFIYDQAANRTRFIIDFLGNVGIGTTTPSATLDLVGNFKASKSIVAGTQSLFATTSVNFSLGNTATNTYDCAGTVTLNNLTSGGSYTLVITGTGTTQCNFIGGGSETFRFVPANTVRTAFSHTVYKMDKVGSTVYVSWKTGF